MIPGVSPRFNRRSAALVAAPAVEPVTVADVKTYIKLDGTDEDVLIGSLIATARRMAEEYTRRSFITQTWALTQDSFSNLVENVSEGYLVAPTPQYITGANTLHLPRGAVQSIVSVKATSSAGVVSTLDVGVYALDAVNGDVVLRSGQSWPTDLQPYSAVKVTYQAGYGDAADTVPVDIVQAIKMQTGAMYDGCPDMAPTVMAILDPYRLPEAFGVW